MNNIIENSSFRKKILEMTDDEYSAVVDRLLHKKKVESGEDALMLVGVLRRESLTSWARCYELLDGFFDNPLGDDCDIHIGEIHLYKMMGLYMKSGNMAFDDVKSALDFAYRLSCKGSFYAQCFMLNIVSMERECCCIESYREYYRGNEFLTRAFGGDNPSEVLGLMAFEIYSAAEGGKKIKAFFYLDSVLFGSQYIGDIVCDLDSLEFDKDFFEEGDFGEKEFILSEYYYYNKNNYEKSIEYAKISSNKGNSGAYVVWALSLYSGLCKDIDTDNDKAMTEVCEVVVKIIDLIRLSLDGFAKNRGFFFKNIGSVEFLEENIPLLLNNVSTPELAIKLCEMASKGSPLEQYLVFDRKEKCDANYDFISCEQAFEWAVNAAEYVGVGDGKIQLNNKDTKDKLVKKINKKRIGELLSY